MSEHTNRTLVFCTAWSPDPAGQTRHWEGRYRRWLDAIKASKLEYGAVLMVDDASESLPSWPDVTVVRGGEPAAPGAFATLYSFDTHLGRHAISDFPGWVRSFGYAALFAERHGFNKVVHIESDAFIISERMQRHINAIDEGWVAFWCPLWNRPESGIQVIAGRELATYGQIAKQDVGILATTVIEDTLPFTHVEKGFIGDRYGERGGEVPRNADYSMQTFPSPWVASNDYYWWMQPRIQTLAASPRAVADRYRVSAEQRRHAGLPFQEFLQTAAAVVAPRTYVVMGTAGEALAGFNCDSLCIDPQLRIDANSVGRKQRMLLFQMTGDEFFARDSLRTYFPAGPDLGFLAGTHHAEVLLRDFMAFERASHGKSVALLQNCLPTNTRMAERAFRRGGADEPEAEREFWTGDVWKLVAALATQRPDLTIIYLDCLPTGLVAITKLDNANRKLEQTYTAIAADMLAQDLSGFGLERLWQLYPTLSSSMLCQHHDDLRQLFGLNP